MAKEKSPEKSAADQLYDEIHNIVTRYSKESEITYRECFGVLAHELHRSNDRKRDER